MLKHSDSPMPRGEFGTAKCSQCSRLLSHALGVSVCERCLARGLMIADEIGPGAVEDGPSEGTPGSGPTDHDWGGIDRNFGDFYLEEELGHGGMGVVYRARQISLRRTVAIKLLLMGQYSGQGAIQRFLREAESAARLRHDGIVTVFEVGRHGGQHYFAMEYVQGSNLRDLLRSGPLTPRKAAAYGQSIALAVHYAHSNGVLHRDLKPENILMDAEDHPRITDFGLAKRLDGEGNLTLTGEVLGTPAYLSPEQASGRHDEVDARSDVYAVGAILYESVTGRPPFLAASIAQILASIRDAFPVSPRRLNPEVHQDLETIVLKCLEKDPRRRYGLARELADDLGRFLRGEPTLARRIGPLGRAHRWARRRPMQAIAAALATVTLMVSGVSSVRLSRAERETARVNAQLAGTIRRLTWQRAEDSLMSGRATDALVTFGRLLRDQPKDEVLATRMVSLLSHRAFAHPVGQALEHDGPVNWVEFDRRTEKLVTASSDGQARIWDLTSGKEMFSVRSDDGPLRRASFCGNDGQLLTVSGVGRVDLWDLAEHRRMRSWILAPGTPKALSLNQDRSRLAIAVEGTRVHIVAAQTGATLAVSENHGCRIAAVALSNDGAQVAVGDEQGRVWISEDGIWRSDVEPRAQLGDEITVMGFNPRGEWLVAGTRSGLFSSVATRGSSGTPIRVVASGEANLVRWSPDGERVLLGRFGEWPELWDMAKGRLLGRFTAMESDVVMDGQWSPDGAFLMLAYRSGSAVVYDPATQRMIREPFEHRGPITRLAFGADARRVATSSHDGTSRIWNLRSPAPAPHSFALKGRVGPKLLSFHDRSVVAVVKDNAAWLCDVTTGDLIGKPVNHPASVQLAEVSPDGKWLATSSAGMVRLWEPLMGTEVHAWSHGSEHMVALSWSPDGTWLAAASSEGQFHRHDVRTFQARSADLGPVSGVQGMDMSSDGDLVAVMCGDSTVRVFQSATQGPRCRPLRHFGRVWTAAFSKDRRQLLTASVDRMARLWNLETGELAVPPMRHDRPVLVARYSPDGRIIASGGEDRMVRLWDAETGRALGAPLVHADRVWLVEFSADGRELLTSEDHGDVRIWDVETGMPLTERISHRDFMLRVWFEPTAGRFLTATHGGQVTHWGYPRLRGAAPSWLPELAEALAGRRIDDHGGVQVAGTGVFEELHDRTLRPAADDFDEWILWYLHRCESGVAPPWQPR